MSVITVDMQFILIYFRILFVCVCVCEMCFYVLIEN